ncbi:MAG: AFG1 family ATPase [Beijerinckiaceae bacterium]|nr:AFG1 family ATPase [Beijerinckiaceae bacterium]
MDHPVSSAYTAKVLEGQVEADAAQRELVDRLDTLLDALAARRAARRSSPIRRLFRRPRKGEIIRGLYVWGSVGRGKTMLMDMFFAAAPQRRKRRAHFHAFMHDVHKRIHAWRQERKVGSVKGDDPIQPVADAIAREARLLCFDEFSVTDIADAMILGRLFEALFARGVVVVATSNVEPSRLYEGGLNRALFLPFIELLGERMEVIHLDARTDFRLEKIGGSPVYYTPADSGARASMDEMFRRLTGKDHGEPDVLPVFGRELKVPEAADHIARFSFAQLCAQPLASADYLALAENYHTIFVDGIPVMPAHMRNEAKRFINLIDTLYDQHVKLVASAEAEPTGLYTGTQGREAFEFERTASRLIEMQSQFYLALPHGRADSAASGSTAGLAET